MVARHGRPPGRLHRRKRPPAIGRPLLSGVFWTFGGPGGRFGWNHHACLQRLRHVPGLTQRAMSWVRISFNGGELERIG